MAATPKKTLLAVDDENDILLILRTALKDDYRVVAASNGPDALAAARAEQPDIILLDMMMPGMDGFEVLEQLRADERTARVPVIFLTGVSERAKIRKALGEGVHRYILKPFKTAELNEAIRQALGVPEDAESTA